MNILNHPPLFQSTPDFHLHLSLSLSLWLFIQFLSIHSFSLQCNQPSLLFLAESGHFSYSHNSAIISLLFTHTLFPFSSSLPIYLSICQLFLPFVNLFLSSTPLNAFIFPQWLHCFSIHPCPSFSPACFPSILLPFSLRRQTKPGSKFIIYQVALKFMVLKGWIRLAASTLSLVWVLRATEIVSQIGLIMFGPGYAWGFISLPRNCFVCIWRQRLADILKRCYSLCLFQVLGVATLCASAHG